MSQRLIDGREVTAKLVKANIQPQSREHRWREIKAGRFPKPMRMGAKNFWTDQEIDDLIARRIAGALAARDQ